MRVARQAVRPGLGKVAASTVEPLPPARRGGRLREQDKDGQAGAKGKGKICKTIYIHKSIFNNKSNNRKRINNYLIF